DSQLKPERFTLLNVYRMRTSHFNKRRPTKIIIHPYNSFPNYEVYVRMRKAYVQHLRANVLVVNWLSTALSVSYVRTAIRAQRVASIIARFVDSIPPTPEIHFIGTSMAVHVSGSASRLMKRNVERITGLDPAGPIYSTFPSSYLLNPGDADFVDVIHTDAGLPKYGHFGINRSLGHVDFYVNGGRNQPGCGRTASALVDPIFDAFAIAGTTVKLPCSPAQQAQLKPQLILWYKEPHKTPFLSLNIDSLKNGATEELNKPRFMIDSSNTFPGDLYVFNASENDSGIYRCRLDYAKDPTIHIRHNMTVIDSSPSHGAAP
ncbi:hypothetical protein QYM36_015427, partial [Artemia franciscana]